MQMKQNEILFPGGLKPFKVKTANFYNVNINASGWVGLNVPTISGYTPLVAMISDYETPPGLYGCANLISAGNFYLYGEPNKALSVVTMTFVYFKDEMFETV